MKKNNIVLLLGVLGFVVMADNWVVSPILPAISENIGIPVERAGLLIAAYMIPFGIFQIAFGPLADRYGKKQIITFSIVLFTIATGLCAAGSGLTDLAAYRALTGIFAASVMPISLALIGDIFPVQERQGAIGTFMGISFLGQGLSMITGGAIAYFLNWRGVFGLYALLSLIPMILIILNYKSLPDTKHSDSKIFAPYLKLASNAKSLFTYILVLLEGIFIIGSFSYLGAFIAEIYHFNYLLIGVIMTAFGLMTVVGGRLSGKLSQETSPRKILTAGLILAVLADLLIYYFGRNIWGLASSVALMGLGFIFTHSTLLTRATEFAMKARGAAMSLVAFCFMGGGGVGTAIGGKIAAAYGLSTVFLVYGVALGVTLALSFILITGQVVSAQSPVLAGNPRSPRSGE
ncbi:MAG: MFS transporter [Deltaproteobacteria bacterium]|nr:MFS transporter [Deltaproteobacteria bacterium]